MDLWSYISVNIWLATVTLISIAIPLLIILMIARFVGKSARKTASVFTRRR